MVDEPSCFHGMEPGAFIHPAEAAALSRLARVPGIAWAAAQLQTHSYPARVRVTQLAGALRISQTCLPRVFELAQTLSQSLDVPLPDFFVRRGATTAYALADNQPLIVLDADLLAGLDAAELRCLIAHEISHVHCQHLPWLMVSDFLRAFAPTLGLAGNVLIAARGRVERWRQAALLSCDRGALLLTGDRAALTRLHLKSVVGALPIRVVGAIPENSLWLQHAEINPPTTEDDAAVAPAPLMEDHPTNAAARAAAIEAWGSSTEYAQMKKGEYPRRDEALQEEEPPALWGAFAPEGLAAFPGTEAADDDAVNTDAVLDGLKKAAGGALGLAQEGAATLGKTARAFLEGLQLPPDSPPRKP